MASFGGLFGPGSAAQQFLIWNVLSELVSAALGPAIADIQQAVNSADPVLPLSPAQLAVGAARGLLDPVNAKAEAAKSGIGPGRFDDLVTLAESPAELGLILQAVRRSLGQVGPGMQAPVDLGESLADLGVSEKYRELITAAVFVQPSAAEVLNAWLEGQIEEGEAVARIKATGLDPSWIQTAYNANGQAPTPTQALELLNRGIIAERGSGPTSTSYEQAFLEGPWRNKWLDSFVNLRFYVPPPRTTQAMLREGTIDLATATKWLKSYGVENDVLTAFLKSSTHATTPEQRELSKSEVLTLYSEQLISGPAAQADLVVLGYSAADAQLLILGVDRKAAAATTKQAVTRIKNLFLAGQQDLAATRAALTTLGIGATQSATLIASWQLEAQTAHRTLTASQVELGWFYELLDTQTALAQLRALGYSPDDALLLLGIKNKGKLTAEQLADKRA